MRGLGCQLEQVGDESSSLMLEAARLRLITCSCISHGCISITYLCQSAHSNQRLEGQPWADHGRTYMEVARPELIAHAPAECSEVARLRYCGDGTRILGSRNGWALVDYALADDWFPQMTRVRLIARAQPWLGGGQHEVNIHTTTWFGGDRAGAHQVQLHPYIDHRLMRMRCSCRCMSTQI